MSSEMTQLNVRLPKELKANVDAILYRYRLSSSEVIRSLWTFIQDKQYIPEFEKKNEHSAEDVQLKNAKEENNAYKNRIGLEDAIAEYLNIDPKEVVLEDIDYDKLYEMAMNDWYEEKLKRCTL